jgi:negative regulator of replication initiation
MARRNSGPLSRIDEQTYSLNIDAQDRETLNSLLDQLRDVLMNDSNSDVARRLFPAAYHQDEQHEHEYQRLMRDELLSSRLASLTLTSSMLERDHEASQVNLTSDELDALMRSINSLRLILGTLLDVDEDEFEAVIEEDDPGYGQYQLYLYLGWLLDWIVRVQTEGN